MTALVPRNRYLVTASGRQIGGRLAPALMIFGPMVAGPVLGIAAATLGAILDIDLLAALGALFGFIAFFGAVVMAWVFLMAGARDNNLATQMFAAGDTLSPIALCQRGIGRVFRADISMRAFYILGLCAEANGDFAEAHDLFQLAFDRVPAMANGRLKRRGQCMMLSHQAIALAAVNRLDEADRAVRFASSLYPQLPGAGGFIDALTNDSAFGALGVSGALRDLEPGRDERALLSLASITVLAARGMPREALDLTERERYFLNAGLLPRERALVSNVEARAHALLTGGPMRSPGQQLVHATDPASAAWAERVIRTA